VGERWDREKIGIMGGTGGMGAWFAAFFRKRGHEVVTAGRREGPSPRELAGLCRVVVVAVPIPATVEVIRAVGAHLPPDSLLMDLTSLKVEAMAAMMETAPGEVVGLHPLFGPRVTSLRGENVVLCPGRGEEGRGWITRVLKEAGARVVVADAGRHDEIMAVVQGLNHLDNLVFGLAVAAGGLSREELAAFSTPAFRARMDLVDRVSANPPLYRALVGENPHVGPHARRFLDLFREQMEALTKKG